MHQRPKRQLKNLLEKLEQKRTRSRAPGKKAKRMAKWSAHYQAVIEGRAPSPKSAKPAEAAEATEG